MTFIDGYKSFIVGGMLLIEGALKYCEVEIPTGTTEFLLGLLGLALRDGMRK